LETVSSTAIASGFAESFFGPYVAGRLRTFFKEKVQISLCGTSKKEKGNVEVSRCACFMYIKVFLFFINID